MEFLKTGDPVVVDAHIIVSAAKQLQHGTAGVELRFLEGVLERCPRIWLSTKQARSGDRRGELVEKMRLAGFRFLQQSTLILRLDGRNKLEKLPSSGADLPKEMLEVFRGRGHQDVSDDAHLYSVARAKRTVVVTLDSNLLDRAPDILKGTKVETLTPEDVLNQWA